MSEFARQQATTPNGRPFPLRTGECLLVERLNPRDCVLWRRGGVGWIGVEVAAYTIQTARTNAVSAAVFRERLDVLGLKAPALPLEERDVQAARLRGRRERAQIELEQAVAPRGANEPPKAPDGRTRVVEHKPPADKQAAYAQRMIAQGRCPICGGERTDYRKKCAECSERRNAWQRKRAFEERRDSLSGVVLGSPA